MVTSNVPSFGDQCIQMCEDRRYRKARMSKGNEILIDSLPIHYHISDTVTLKTTIKRNTRSSQTCPVSPPYSATTANPKPHHASPSTAQTAIHISSLSALTANSWRNSASPKMRSGAYWHHTCRRNKSAHSTAPRCPEPQRWRSTGSRSKSGKVGKGCRTAKM